MSLKKNKKISTITINGVLYKENKLFNMPVFPKRFKDKKVYINENGEKVKNTVKVKNLVKPSEKENWLTANVGRCISLPLWSKKSDLTIHYINKNEQSNSMVDSLSEKAQKQIEKLGKPTVLQWVWRQRQKTSKKTTVATLDSSAQNIKEIKKQAKEEDKQAKLEEEKNKIPVAEQEIIESDGDQRTAEEIASEYVQPEEVVEISLDDYKTIVDEKEEKKQEKLEAKAKKEEEKQEEKEKKIAEKEKLAEEKEKQTEEKNKQKAETKAFKKEQRKQDKQYVKSSIKYYMHGIFKACPEKPLRAALTTGKVVATIESVLCIVSLYSYIQNNKPFVNTNHIQIGDNFDDVEGIETDDQNNIVTNPTTPEDKENLTKLLEEKLLEEPTIAKLGIKSIDEILSVSRLDQNLFDGDNEDDKYIISIIFKSNDKFYCQNYVDGREIEEDDSNPEIAAKPFYQYDNTQPDKQNMMNFITYLQNCATDSCTQMSESQMEILKKLQEETPDIFYVGNCFDMYATNGSPYFAIPVFGKNEDGTYVRIYKVEQSSVNGIINNLRQCNEKFYQKIVSGKIDNDGITWDFAIEEIKDPESLIKIFKVISSFKQDSSTSAQKLDNIEL